MTTEEGAEQASSQEERGLSGINQSAQALTEPCVRIESHFRRAEVRTRVGRYLQGLLAEVSRKNGWQLAERGTGRSECARSAAEALRSRLG